MIPDAVTSLLYGRVGRCTREAPSGQYVFVTCEYRYERRWSIEVSTPRQVFWDYLSENLLYSKENLTFIVEDLGIEWLPLGEDHEIERRFFNMRKHRLMAVVERRAKYRFVRACWRFRYGTSDPREVVLRKANLPAGASIPEGEQGETRNGASD